MEKTNCGGRQLSRLMLGTVQLGLPYGIANESGRPSIKEATEIIATAYAGGVNCLDTAAGYGSSEAVIGKVLKELGLADRIAVATKILPVPPEATSREAGRAIESSLMQSLHRLGLESIPICLFHRESDAAHLEHLQRWKDRGVVGQIGVSVNTPEGAAAIVEAGGIDAMQLPCNLLDRRFLPPGIAGRARQRGIAVFARSSFLQGLLCLPVSKIPPALSEVAPVCRRLESLARREEMTLMEMAARYVMSRPEVSAVVVGVEAASQIESNLALFAGRLPDALMVEIDAAVPDLPETILNAALWPS